MSPYSYIHSTDETFSGGRFLGSSSQCSLFDDSGNREGSARVSERTPGAWCDIRQPVEFFPKRAFHLACQIWQFSSRGVGLSSRLLHNLEPLITPVAACQPKGVRKTPMTQNRIFC